MQTSHLSEIAELISIGPIVVYTCEAFGDFAATSITSNIKDQLGYDSEEFLSEPGFWASNIHPNDRSVVLKNLSKFFENGRHSHDYRFRHKDGSYRWMHDDLLLVVDDNQQPTSIVGYWTDITSRKQTEEAMRRSESRLADILNVIAEGVITINEDMKIALFNQGAERIFGYQAEEVLGEPLEILMSQRLRKRHVKFVQEFDQSDDEFLLMGSCKEVAGLHKDGTEFPALVSVSKLIIENEKLYTVVIYDNTERKLAEENMNKAKSDAEFANQAKSQFLASMSHELRTPLNAILGFSDIISQQYLGPIGTLKYKEYADDIHSSGEHLLSLINDILDISVIEAGRLSISKEKLSAGELVRECVATVSLKASDNAINLNSKIPSQLTPLYADKRAIKQILLNLLSNSLRYTPKDGKITVSVKALKGKIVFTVADTGTGIPPDLIPGLTAPFVRAEQNSHNVTKGWGLGLAISKSLIDLHNGEMDIQSEVGKGTLVTLILPNEKM